MRFFLLVYALSVPFWLLGTVVKVRGLPDNLPITDVGATFVPLIAAVILVWREEGTNGVKRLASRTFDYHRIQKKVWYIPVLFLIPALFFLTYWLMRLARMPIPTTWQLHPMALMVFLGFFVAAIGEELGYMGYAIDPMQEHQSAITASLLLGSIWALWHLPSMLQIGQSPTLIVFGLIATVAFRVLYVWLYNNNNRCVFAVILFHAIGNTSRTLFPGGRASFELKGAVFGYTMVVLTAIVVVILWGSSTLSHFRHIPSISTDA